MDINALVISGSDLGAVPSGSLFTNTVIWGRNRIDERVKGRLCLGGMPPLSAQKVQLQMTIVLQ